MAVRSLSAATDNPATILRANTDRRTFMPDIVEWVMSDRYLNRPNIYPRQLTLLKTIFLQDELFCADEETEILTRRGWKRFDEVIEGEDVMALDHQSGQGEWVPAERINVFPVAGVPMRKMTAKSHSSMTTLDHRWPVERYEQGAPGPRWEKQWRTTAELQGRDRVLCAAPVGNLPTEETFLSEFVELVGWYWTEGHLRTGHHGVTIVQSHEANPENVERIRDALTKVYGPGLMHLQWDDEPAWTESQVRGMTVFRLNRAASDPLVIAAPGSEKVVSPEFLTSLTEEQIRLFIEVSILADGYTKGPSRGISQASRARLDSFQMACSLAGIRSALREQVVGGAGRYSGRTRYTLSLQETRQHLSFQRVVTEDVEHTGVVWCPTTKHGSWLARRDGHVYFTGNTSYDYDVLYEWANGFRPPPPPGEEDLTVRWQGDWGIVPDVLDRIKYLKANGYEWFRTVLAIMGRRSGKGYIGGIAGSYVVGHYIHMADPKAAYGVDADKRLACQVFAGKKAQARDNQWRDIVSVIQGSPFLQQYISASLGESLTIFTPRDRDRATMMRSQGVGSEMDIASMEIVPKEATTMAARGPASFMQFWDEGAHMQATGQSRSMEEVWEAATPALDQFKKDAFIYSGSSPWAMMGKFYELAQQTLEVDAETFAPVYPENLLIQLASWDIYEDWEKTKTRKFVAAPQRTVPAEITADGVSTRVIPTTYFRPLRQAIQTFDEAMVRLERANPETFRVERRCLDPDTRVLKADLTWSRIDDLIPGDEVLSVDERPPGDGTQRRMRTAVVKAKWDNWDDAYRITFTDGTSVVCSGKHRWLSGGSSSHGSYRWRHLFADPGDPGPRQIIKPGDEIAHLVDPWVEDDTWEAGYLAGVYDGEGTAIGYPRREFRISFVQNPNEVLDATLEYLRDKGFHPRYMPKNKDSKKIQYRAQTWVIQGLPEVLRFVGQIGGHKMARQAIPSMWEGRGLGRVHGKTGHKVVASIEPVGNQRLVDIETSTGTFFAEGLISHNSKWATALDAYFSAEMVDRMFMDWKGLHLENRTKPERTNIDFLAHGDPGKVGSNFGFAIAHVVPDPDGDSIPHVVFDYIKAWTAGDFPELTMNYPSIRRDLEVLMDNYQGFKSLTFDQYNSISIIQELQTFARGRYFKRVSISEHLTTAKTNWTVAETTKMALSLGKVHAPYHELADLEFKFLQKHPTADKVDHPDTGPVTTKDVYDAMSIVIWNALGQQIASAYGDQFSSLVMAKGMPGPANYEVATGQRFAPGTMSSADNDVAAAFSRYADQRLDRARQSPRMPSRGINRNNRGRSNRPW